jgi:hypothetical protein
MTRTLRAALLAIGAATLALTTPAATAAAAPTNAPDQLSGTADCGSAGSFDFVVNSGRANANTWSPAFITATDGSTGLFIPASFDLTFTSPFGTDTEQTSKATAPGPVTCEISASPEEGFSLTGTVTGRIVWTG